MSVKRLVPLNNLVSNHNPVGSKPGDMYLDTITGRILVYFNGEWKALAYLVDVDQAATAIFDGGYFDTVSYSNTINAGYYNTESNTQTVNAGALA